MRILLVEDDRNLADIVSSGLDKPEASAEFDVTFEPEEYLAKVRSAGRLFAPDQREELQIRYRDALSSMPAQPGLDRNKEVSQPHP